MYRLYAVWTHPTDVEAFERHYLEVHTPLAAAIPGLQRLVLTRTADTLNEEPSPFHRITELWFEDKAALEVAVTTPEAEATIEDAAELQQRFGAELHTVGGVAEEAELPG